MKTIKILFLLCLLIGIPLIADGSAGKLPEIFPMGFWGIKPPSGNTALIYFRSGATLGLYHWECNDFAQFAKEDKEKRKLSVYSLKYWSDNNYVGAFYTAPITLSDKYPVQYDPDSIEFWSCLAEIVVDSFKTEISENSPLVYNVKITNADHHIARWSPLFWEGIRKINTLFHLSSIKTFCYPGTFDTNFLNNKEGKGFDAATTINTGCYFYWYVSLNDPDYSYQIQRALGSLVNEEWKKYQYYENQKKPTPVSIFYRNTSKGRKVNTEYWPELGIQWKENDLRTITEPELRVITSLAVTYGVKGITFYSWCSGWDERNGIVDTEGKPYMPQDSADAIFGENVVTANENNSVWLYFYHVASELADYGRAFRELTWDTAFSYPLWDDGENIATIPPEKLIEGVEGWKKGNPDKPLQYAEIGLFKDNHHRDYIMVVNRHCLHDDTFYITCYTKETEPQPPEAPHKFFVDMKNFKYKEKQYYNGKPGFRSEYQPGEGKLWAVVTDAIPPPNKPWGVWAIIILEHNGTKYTIYTPWDRPDWLDEIDKNAEVTYTIKIAVRGELFRHGPRAKDVDSVVVELWDIEGANAKLIDNTWKKEKVYENYVPENVEWADDECYLFTYIPSQINSKKFGHSYNAYIKVKAYNSFGRLIDEKVFPFTPWWFVPGNTKHTCQRNDVDPDGKWYIAYTEETEDTPRVHLFTLGNNETISSGKFPTLAVKGDTIGVAFLSKNSDTIYYTYKIDSTWSSPYPIVSSLPHSLSVPRTGVYKDTVYLSYQKRTDLTSFSKILSEPGDNTGIYLERFPITKPEERVSQEVSTWYEDISDIEPRGAGIGVDAFGNVYMGWRENDLLRFGVIYPSGDKRIYGGNSQPFDDPITCMLSPGGGGSGFVPGILYTSQDKLILSLFHPADTTEILRDTLYEGNEIRSAKSVGGGVVFDEAGCIKFLKWDAVNNGISEVTELTQAQKSSYPSIDGVSYIKDNTIHRDYYLIWTEDVTGASFLPDSLKEDTLSMVATEILSYSGDGHEGLMPYVYLRGGFEPPSIFTLHRDSFAVYGDEIYEKVDIGYDSLVYEFPGSRQRIRMFFEFYTPDETYETSEVNLKINGLNLASFTIQPSEVERYEFWIPDSLSLDTVRVFLKRLSGDYIPLSRMIVESFEIRDDGASYRGYSGIKEVRDYSTFSFYSLTNVISKGNALFFYTLPYGTQVKVKVYDVGGRLLRVLEDGYQEKGRYKMEWDLRDASQRKAPKGVYFVRFEAGGYKRTEKILITE